MAQFKALNGRRCICLIGWLEFGEARLFGLDLVHQDIEILKVIPIRLIAGQSSQKSYADVRRSDVKFDMDDWAFLKRVGSVAYGLAFPTSLGSIYPAFHMSMLRRCGGDPSLVVPIENVGVSDSLSYKEVLVEMFDRHVHRLQTKDVSLVKVLWRNHKWKNPLGNRKRI
ncbi:uncharacterized protein LOC124888910 [Capsicum annuum]|uniref:uncharacterized protein LOC124888910 n=1 Tax=Capsicum annuum TaxID=4072 RepID=UPI001FB06239|nr:uncharacterized protein LOC124888910 [Capsicum annuum]